MVIEKILYENSYWDAYEVYYWFVSVRFFVFFKIEQLATDLNCIVEKLYAEITEQSR